MSSPARRLAERYLSNVKEAGDGNLRAACPFHTSSSSRRSLYIFGGTGAWTCFGCGAGGTVPSLLYKLGMNRSQVDSALALVNFSKWKPPSPRSRIRWARKTEWDTLPEWLLGTYDWLPNRMLWWGFEEDQLQDYGIGYDREHSRITFPVRDHLGRLVGISGRAEPGGFPRYKVYDARPGSPDEGVKPGELYGAVPADYTPNNRLHLYGFDRFYADRLFRRDDDLQPFIFVEGYKGAMKVVQNGHKHTSALQGSSMTRHQEEVASMVRGPYYTLLDNEPGKAFPDAEGRCSAFRITDRMAKYDRSYVCQYPPGSPIGTAPDDLSSDELRWVIENAMTTAQARLSLQPQRDSWKRTASPTRKRDQ